MHPPIRPTHRRWSNRAIAHEVDPYRTRRLSGAILAILLAAAPFGAYMLEQNECVSLAYEVDALEIEQERLIERQRRLRVQRAALESLDEIETWAVNRHGLRRPSSTQVVVVAEPEEDPGSLVALESGSR